MAAIIEVNRLSKSFGNQKVLEDVNLRIAGGKITGLLGPNGTGKTTLIRLLNGVIKPDSGSISIKGMNPELEGNKIRKISGIVTESAGLYHQMTGEENLKFYAGIYEVKEKNRINELLGLFDLKAHKDKLTGKYSTGMKKRLALAKALLHRPEILFLDEPTNGLDPDGIKMVLSYLKKYNQETGTTIIICSHVLHQLETVCDSFAFMENGRIIEQGNLTYLESTYLKEVTLQVETTFRPEEQHYIGYPCKTAGEDKVIFMLPSRQEIPVLLQELLKRYPVYTAKLLHNDLESIYFRVREKSYGKLAE